MTDRELLEKKYNDLHSLFLDAFCQGVNDEVLSENERVISRLGWIVIDTILTDSVSKMDDKELEYRIAKAIYCLEAIDDCKIKTCTECNSTYRDDEVDHIEAIQTSMEGDELEVSVCRECGEKLGYNYDHDDELWYSSELDEDTRDEYYEREERAGANERDFLMRM